MIGKINILLNLGLTIFSEADSGGFATFGNVATLGIYEWPEFNDVSFGVVIFGNLCMYGLLLIQMLCGQQDDELGLFET